VALGPRARRELARGRPRPIVWWAVVASLGRGPFHFGPRPYGVCFRFVGIFVCVLLSFRKGGFPWLLGALMVVSAEGTLVKQPIVIFVFCTKFFPTPFIQHVVLHVKI
jgi:hypothetical protein